MSIVDTANLAVIKLQLAAAPVSGTPTAPGDAGTAANTIWGYVLWGVAIIGTFALAGTAVMAYSNHQQGRSNDSVAKGALVIAGVIGAAMAPTVIGAITGT